MQARAATQQNSSKRA